MIENRMNADYDHPGHTRAISISTIIAMPRLAGGARAAPRSAGPHLRDPDAGDNALTIDTNRSVRADRIGNVVNPQQEGCS